MKTTLQTLILFLAICSFVSSSNAQNDTITILHLNDSHSGLTPRGPRGADLKGTYGGIARAASVIGMTKLSESNTLVLHAGDFAMGDIMYNVYFGVPELRLLSMIGLDAMTLGNHEFDLTPVALQQTLDTAFADGGKFPILSANCVLEDISVEPLKKYIEPWTIKTIGGVKVGIFGLTTPETNLLSQPAPAFLDTNIAQIAYTSMDTLRKQGCQVVILLSHLGYDLDAVVAANIPGIDLIVGGHDHYVFSEPRYIKNPLNIEVPIVQAGAHYEYIGKMRLNITPSGLTMLDYTMIPLDANIPEEPTIAAVMDDLITGVETQYGQVYSGRLCTAHDDHDEVAEDLLALGSHDTPVGNLVTDAFRAATGADIAIEVGGSTSDKLYKGEIVAADMFRMIGYGYNLDNGLGYRLATFKMTGEALATGLEFGLSDIEHNDEFLVQTSGMYYQYNVDAPPFQRLIGALIGDKPLDLQKTYWVAANEFAVMFLSTIGIPISDVHIYNDTTEFQVVSSYAAARDTLIPIKEGRVSSVTMSIGKTDGLRTNELKARVYPNPAHTKAQLQFQSDGARPVNAAVFNTNGVSIRRVASGVYPEGNIDIDLDVSSLPSGNYRLMITDGFRATLLPLVISR